MSQQTFVIGDIHGALKAVEELLSIIRPKGGDKLIFLGDYVDGWSQSAQVIDYLLTLSDHYECIFIKGNHDAWCEQWLQGKGADKTWLFHGGKGTIKSYEGYSKAHLKEHEEFFNRLQHYHVDGDNRLFIHAGFSSMQGPAHERDETNCYWDRSLWEMAVTMDSRITKDSKLYPKRLLLFSEIFIGHTPTLYFGEQVPMQGGNVWNIDTGAAFTGKLTAMNVKTKEYLQTRKVQELYPQEKGRN